MVLVLGLGNPGQRYRDTRHNAGFLVADRIAGRHGGSCDRKQLGAQVGTVRVGETPVVVAKPQSFMNLSGQVGASLRGFYKVEATDVVVVHDDIDLPFGDVRVKSGGGHGGHNGLRDLQTRLGTNDFARVRFGVGRPPEGRDVAQFVLAPFTPAEQSVLPELIDRAADAVEHVVTDGVGDAMSRINVRRRAAADTPT